MTNHDRETPEPPYALCCCGTPLITTLEMPKKEWWCVKCKKFYEWLHARRGDGPNPSEELEKQYDAALRQYDKERERRITNSLIKSKKEPLT